MQVHAFRSTCQFVKKQKKQKTKEYRKMSF